KKLWQLLSILWLGAFLSVASAASAPARQKKVLRKCPQQVLESSKKVAANGPSEAYTAVKNEIQRGFPSWTGMGAGLLSTPEGRITGFPSDELERNLRGLTDRERKNAIRLVLQTDPQLQRTPLVFFVMLDPRNPEAWKILFTDSMTVDALPSGLESLDGA